MDVAAVLRLEKNLVTEAPEVLHYLRDAFVYLKSVEIASRRTQSLVREILARLETNEIQTDSKKSIVDGIDKQKTEVIVSSLVESINAESNLVNQAFLIGLIVQQLMRYFPSDDSKPFSEAIENLLSSGDDNLRIFAASAVALSDYPAKNLKILVPVLRRGLESEEFLLRYYSQISLVALAKQVVCFNPLDSAAERSKGIREWEKWWKDWIKSN